MEHYNIKCNVDIEKLYQEKDIFPRRDDIFKAMELCPIEKVKVVILGQDPYPTPGNAMGLSFSVPVGTKIPASLKNIYKEAGIKREDGNLVEWAKSGVLLLNTILTVKSGQPLSHRNVGWVEYTKEIIFEINKLSRRVVFLLWGGNAKKYKKYLTNDKHIVLESGHPSPLSANRGYWFGNGHFTELEKLGIKLK